MSTISFPIEMQLDSIKKHILQTSIAAWDRHVTESSLARWLNNFTGKALGDENLERIIAAWLLFNFTFYSNSEVNELCKIIYRKYIHEKLNQSKYKKSGKSIAEQRTDIISRTYFAPLGNPSESSCFILYLFRTSNGLPKDCFDPILCDKKLAKHEIDDVVLIDDVTISGTQASDYLKNKDFKGSSVTLLTFFAAPAAIDKLSSDHPELKVIYVHFLDDRTKLFSKESFLFSNDESSKLRDYVDQLCNVYGKWIVENDMDHAQAYMRDHPLGFANGQQLFGFYYNTPDNTLPIIWHQSNEWFPVFKRHPKVYTMDGGNFDGKYW